MTGLTNLTPNAVMSLADAAVNLGLPVFPCNLEKKPVNEHGWKGASDDPDRIRQEFSRPTAQMIAMPTGAPSGQIAIDIEVKTPGVNGNDWLDEHAYELPPTRTHYTQSGGLHLLFKNPEGVEIRNSAGRLAPGVDVRGNGGYIIIPPSPGYTIADHTEPADMPLWLIQACQKRVEPPPPPQPYTRQTNGSHDRYAETALHGECRAVATAPDGTRNDRLNIAAVKLGSLVGAGLLSRATVERELTAAATTAGLDPREIPATINSGMTYGVEHPREVPERQPKLSSEVRHIRPHHNQDNKRNTWDTEPLPLPLLWFAEIRPVTDANDFVQGLLTSQGAAVVYGESNTGKTFWTTDLALHVAAGLSWFGKRVNQGGVIYCVLEGGIGFRNRIAGWKIDHDLEGKEIPFAAIPASLNLLDPAADTPRLIATIKAVATQLALPVKLVVIDTLSRAMAGGNENGPDDMGSLVLNMDAIRAATGACVLFVHHSGKDQARGARGHSLLRAAIDTEIEVVADHTSKTKVAKVVKQRELPKEGAYGFTLRIVELGENQYGEPVTTCVTDPHLVNATTGQRQLSGHNKRAFEILVDLAATAGQSGHAGVPSGVLSIPEKDWRDAFYKCAMAGSEQDTKKKAFRRAADALVESHVVGMAGGRVWPVPKQAYETGHQPGQETGHDPL
jgi:hypothetical protein